MPPTGLKATSVRIRAWAAHNALVGAADQLVRVRSESGKCYRSA